MRPKHRLWASVALLAVPLFAHAFLKLPWSFAGLAKAIKRRAPHTLPPLSLAVVSLTGLVSCAVKAFRLSRFSDPEATIETGFFAVAIAAFTGPRSHPSCNCPLRPVMHQHHFVPCLFAFCCCTFCVSVWSFLCTPHIDPFPSTPLLFSFPIFCLHHTQ